MSLAHSEISHRTQKDIRNQCPDIQELSAMLNSELFTPFLNRLASLVAEAVFYLLTLIFPVTSFAVAAELSEFDTGQLSDTQVFLALAAIILLMVASLPALIMGLTLRRDRKRYRLLESSRETLKKLKKDHNRIIRELNM